MFYNRAGWFRDFACFSAFLILFSSLVESGYGQQPQTLPEGVEAGSGRASSGAVPAAPGTRRASPHSVPLPNAGSTFRSSQAPQTIPALPLGTPSPQQILQQQILGTTVPQLFPNGIATAMQPRLGRAVASGLGLSGVGAPGAAGINTKPLGDTITPFVKGALPSGRSVKPHQAQLNGNDPVDDPTDPYIVAQAELLNNDPNKIFAFVRDQVKFDVYGGSLRGARGTLWNMAGNSLDRASLLVALLGAAGFSAQYVEGKLTTAQEQQLILSMFTPPANVTGCPPTGTTVANPANDASLQKQVGDHWWVVYGPSGSTNPATPMDANFAGAQIGQVFGTAGSQMQTVPSFVRHYVTFRLQVEQYQQASALLAGSGFSTTEVLNESYDTPSLVGRPVSVGHFVTGGGISSLFSDITFSYTPYLRIGQNDNVLADDLLVQGQTYQENYTNFPLGTQIVTGIFLYMDVSDSQGNTQTYERDWLDRIGYSARTLGTSVQVSTPSTPQSAVSPYDFQTVNVLGGQQGQSILQTNQSYRQQIQTQTAALAPQISGIDPTNATPAQEVILQQAQAVTVSTLVALARNTLSQFDILSDGFDANYSQEYLVHAYFTQPRLTIFTTKFTPGPTPTTPNIFMAIDLRSDQITVVPNPGQAAQTVQYFNFARGTYENFLEQDLMQQTVASVTGGSNLTVEPNTLTMFSMAQAAGIGVNIFSATNPVDSAPSNYSLNAIARMDTAVAAGKIVLVPAQSIVFNGVLQTSWFEIDPSTGYMVGVTEDGGHQEAAEEGATEASAISFVKSAEFWIGVMFGLFVGMIGFVAIQLADSPLCQYKSWIEDYDHAVAFINVVTGVIAAIKAAISKSAPGAPAFIAGFEVGIAVFEDLEPIILNHVKQLALACQENEGGGGGGGGGGEPSAAPVSAPPLLPSPMAGTSKADPPALPMAVYGFVSPTGTATSSLNTSLASDPTTSVPVNGAQLPLAFLATLQSGEQSTDTFSVSVTPPSGFSAEQPLPSVTLPPSSNGQMGFCLAPTGTLPAPGTQVSVSIKATSATNSSVSSTSTATVTVPSVPGIVLSASPASYFTTPGAKVTAALQIFGAGNVSTSATLTLAADPSLSVQGLSSPVTLNPNQTLTQSLTITPSTSAPLSVGLLVNVTATFGDPTNPQTSTVTIPVTIQATQALPAAGAAPSAAAVGRTDVASTLAGLGPAISALVAGCTSTTLATFQNYAHNLFEQVETNNSGFFSTVINNSGSTFNDVSNATCSNYTTALTELNTFITGLGTLFNSPAAYPFQLGLAPSTVVAQPNSTSTFKITMTNQSQVTQTYNLSVTGIPAGLGGLNTTSVTIPAQGVIPAGTSSDPAVTISQTGTTLQSFSFTVTAVPAGIAGASQSTTGTVNLRPDVIDVQDVTAVPGFVTAGGSVDILTHIANAVNQPTPVKVSLKVLNSSNQQIASAGPVSATMTVATLLTSVDFGQVTIPSGTPNGNYTLSVTVTDANGNALTGGTGTGFLLVGSPVTATLTVTPQTVPSGSNTTTVLNTLTVAPTAGNGNSLQLVGSVATASQAESVALNGNTAYVCDQNELSVVDITNPASPKVLTTALSDFIVSATDIHCAIQQGDLVIFADTNSTLNGNNPGYLAFGLTNPQSPNLLAGVPFAKRFVGEPVLYVNNTAFLNTNAQFFFRGEPPFGQAGDIVSVNISNVTNPVVSGTLSKNGDPTYGGPNEFFGEALYNSQILYGGSSTNSGSAFGGGAGALDVVNISDPTNLSLINQATVSTGGINYLYNIVTQGNLLVARANTGTYGPTNQPATINNSEFVVVFDISNPQSPVLLSATPTNTFCCIGNGQAVLGPNQFLFGGTMDAATNGKPLLELVDTTNPAKPVITPISVPVAPNSFIVSGNFLYAPNDTGLSIYSVPGNKLNSVITGYTAIVQTSNAGAVTYDSTSFNVTPSRITHGSGFDTIEWDNPNVSSLTWNSKVTGLAPAQLATVDQGGTISFTSTLGNGTVNIGVVDVNADQIISLSPASQTLATPFSPGASYSVTVRNPTTSSVTYALSVGGIPQSWTTTNVPTYNPSLPASTTIPALGSVTIPFTIIPDSSTVAATYTFQVIANATGIYGSVEGTLIYTYQFPSSVSPGPGAPSTYTASNVVIQVIPQTATAGPGTNALFQVQITNIGPVSDTFSLDGFTNFTGSNSNLPDLFGQFGANNVAIGPGQTFTTSLAMSVPTGTAPGSVPILVEAFGQTHRGQGQTTATVNVVSNGLTLTPVPQYQTFVNASSTAQVMVTNTGSVSDTFALSLSSPGAMVTTLSSNSVTLAAGASQNVTLTIGSPTFAALGSLPLLVTGTSQANSAISASLSLNINIPYSLGVTAAFQPATQNSPATFPLNVQNTGSAQDNYSAKITKVTGSIQANLVNLDGTATQQIPQFTLPGVSAGQIFLNVTGTAPGTVTVLITSLSDPTQTATATATVAQGSSPLAPIASAGSNQSVVVGTSVTLDGSQSSDPNTPPLTLTYNWTLVTAPTGSKVTTASITNPTAVKASFTPDIVGAYTFQLQVSNSAASSTANVTITAGAVTGPLAPVAKAAAPATAQIGTALVLDGSASFDPNPTPLALTYQWTVTAKPAASALTNASIQNATAAKATVVLDAVGAYTFQLQVTNSVGSSTATVSVTGIALPVANAGKNLNVPVGKYLLLNGSQSYDPAGGKLTFLWTITQQPSNSQVTIGGLRNAATPRPTFLPDQPGAYTFQLIVNNGSASSLPSTVIITAVSGTVPPNANAGKPENAGRGLSAALDGSASFDPNIPPLALTYSWTLQQAPSGSKLTTAGIVNATQAKASFVPDVDGVFTLLLTVSNGSGINSDTVAVTASDPDVPPTARAGSDRRVLPGVTVTLDGTGSFDADGSALTDQWQFVYSVLPNSSIQNPTSPQPTFLPVSTGFYVTRLQVTDKGNLSAADNVTVMVANQCDANADGVIDQADFDLITALAGTPALPGDPLDANGDGVIDSKDVTACQPQPPTLPSFGVDQTELIFNYVSGDKQPPPAQIVHVVSGGALLPFSVSSNATWVAANPSSGTTNAAVQVSVDPSQLPIGNFAAIMTFSALRPANPGSVNVTIVFHIQEPPRLTLLPAVVNFQYQQGGALPAPQNISVVAVTRNLAYTVTTSANWIQVTPATATTPSNEAVSLTNLGNFQPGSYTGTVTFTANDGSGTPQTVQVNLVVLPAPPAITAAGVTNAASDITGAVAPGEIVNISGTYFGPAQLVKQQGTGFVATSLANTQVLFEGVPAPILSVVSGVVQAVAPFFLDGRTNASLQVVYQGVVSNTLALTIVKATPGVYTANGSGTGQAMALNADGTVNSVANPATRGGKLTFYITGGGQLNPGGFDGRIAAAPLSTLVQPITVQIGGQTATATAGDALGMVEGFVEVDATIPQNIPAGQATLLVTVGSATSQSAVTVSVK